MKLENKNKIIDIIVAIIPVVVIVANIKVNKYIQNAEAIKTILLISLLMNVSAFMVGVAQYSKLKNKNRGNSLAAVGTVLNFIVGIYIMIFFEPF
jgi:hypothetical protein